MNFKANESAKKLRGGYYTPAPLSAFLSRWVAEANPTDVCEPSVGDGEFIEAWAKHGNEGGRLTCFELDADEAKKASQRANELGVCAEVRQGDFLQWAIREIVAGRTPFDGVLGNPPFIRYQYLPPEFQERAAAVFKLLGCKFTKHTNAWVPFILACTALLRPGGRLAMVIPSEILYVLHAQSLRTYLGQECSRLVIVDPEDIWFEDTTQGAVILMLEKRRDRSEYVQGLGIYQVKGLDFTKEHPADVFARPQAINGKTVAGKWTRALLGSDVLDVLARAEKDGLAARFTQMASVDVGIVTGANKFFLVNDEAVDLHELAPWTHPMFGRSNHCQGVVYDERQHRLNKEVGFPTNFVYFPNEAVQKNPAAKAYIRLGEQQKLPKRYKCSMRTPWFTVPSVYATEVGMLKRCHDAPRLILNRLRAYTTDTAYRIRPVKDVRADVLVSSFMNPLTALSAELEGRTYGGGVLELVPSEIERLLLPVVQQVPPVEELDVAVRENSVSSAIAAHGRSVLREAGFSDQDVCLLHNNWDKLRRRRQRDSSDDADDDE